MDLTSLRQRPRRVPAPVVDAGLAVAVAVAITIAIGVSPEQGARHEAAVAADDAPDPGPAWDPYPML